MFNVRTLRIFCLFISVFSCLPAMADAVKCRQSNGKIVISNIGCDENATTVSVQRSDNIPYSQQQNAINDVQRQRQYLNNLDRERQTSYMQTASNTDSHRGAGNAFDPDTRDRIYACLMKLTSTFGLSASDQARRKVYCYQNTKNLAGECESSVAATMGLRSDIEQAYKAQCRAMFGA